MTGKDVITEIISKTYEMAEKSLDFVYFHDKHEEILCSISYDFITSSIIIVLAFLAVIWMA